MSDIEFLHANTIELDELVKTAQNALKSVEEGNDYSGASQHTLDILHGLTDEYASSPTFEDEEIPDIIRTFTEKRSGTLINDDYFGDYIEQRLRNNYGEDVLDAVDPWLSITIDYSAVQQQFEEFTIDGETYFLER